MLCLVCLTGLPGAGKTKLAYSLYDVDFARVVVLEFDKFIENFKNWKIKRRKLMENIKNQINPNCKTLVILDDNFYYRSMRHECFKIAKDLKASYCQIYVNTNVIQCLKNNLKRCFPVPTEVILRMNYLFEEPSLSWEKKTLTTHDPDLNIIKDFLKNCFDSKIEIQTIPETQTQTQTQNKIHYADLAARKYISEFLKKSNKPNLGKEMAFKKSEIIKKVKSGEICLPDINDNVIECYVNLLKEYFENVQNFD